MEPPSSTNRRSQRQARRSEPSTLLIPEAVPLVYEAEEDPADGADDSVRCICGQTDYPGVPSIPQGSNKSRSRNGHSNEIPQHADAEVEGAVPGDWFIQCENCNAWQHGGCMGILLESSAPQLYLCEQCDPNSHSIGVDVNGQSYSLYDSHTKKTPKGKATPSTKHEAHTNTNSPDTRTSDHLNLKRRSTLNSRLAADMEEEELRLALEASKQDAPKSADGTGRGMKRGRDGSSSSAEHQAKKRRTSSNSAEDQNSRSSSQSNDTARNDDATLPLSSRTRKGAQPKSPTKPAPRSKVATGARKGRSNAKDDVFTTSPPAPPSRTTSTRATAAASKTNDITPPGSSRGQMSAPPSRQKGAKAAAGKRGRLGRNQYSGALLTEEDGLVSRSASPGSARRPVRSRNTSSYRGTNLNQGLGISGHDFGAGHKPRNRATNYNRMSMNDLKRRVAVIGEFVSMATAAGSSSNGGRSSSGGSTVNGVKTPNSPITSEAGKNGSPLGVVASAEALVKKVAAAVKEKNEMDIGTFKQMSTEEMKVAMANAIGEWQLRFGKLDR